MPRRRPRSTNIVGVAIDGDVIRGTQLRRVLGRTRVVRCAEVEIPASITEHGHIVDRDGFVEALRELWRVGGFRTKHLAFALDGRDATFRRLEIPVVATELVDDAARCELATILPYDIEEAVCVVHEVDRRADGVDVVAVAARRSSVEMVADAAAAAGLRLRDLTLSSTALGLGLADSSGEHTIVSVDRVTTTIVVHRAGQATVTRVLTGGGGERSTEMADELEQALASVDQFRRGGVADQRAGDEPRLRRFRTVVDEVAAAIRFEESQVDGGGTVGVKLTGAYGADPALVAMLNEGIDDDVSVAPPPAWWDAEEPFATFAAAAGAALNAFDGRSSVVHLDPPSAIERGQRNRELVAGLAAAALLALVGARIVGQAGADETAAEGLAVEAELRAELLAARVDDLVDVADLRADVETREEVVQEAVAGEIWWPRVLDEVAAVMPDDTFLTGVTLRRPRDDSAADGQEPTATFSAIALEQAGTAEWMLAVDALDVLDELWLVQSTASVYGDQELPVVAFVAEGVLTDAARSPRAVAPSPRTGGELS